MGQVFSSKPYICAAGHKHFRQSEMIACNDERHAQMVMEKEKAAKKQEHERAQMVMEKEKAAKMQEHERAQMVMEKEKAAQRQEHERQMAKTVKDVMDNHSQRITEQNNFLSEQSKQITELVHNFVKKMESKL